MWFGLSDYCVTYRRTADYLDSVTAKMGAKTVEEFVRFYVSPAMGHSMSGPGASTTPLLSALEEWVEAGRAPRRSAGHAVRRICRAGSHAPALSVSLVPALPGKGRSQGREQLHLRR